MSKVKIVIITVLNLCLTENTRRVVLCKEVVGLYCHSRTKFRNAPFGKNTVSVHIKAGLAYSKSSAVSVQRSATSLISVYLATFTKIRD
jgi:hypothetical protein